LVKDEDDDMDEIVGFEFQMQVVAWKSHIQQEIAWIPLYKALLNANMRTRQVAKCIVLNVTQSQAILERRSYILPRVHRVAPPSRNLWISDANPPPHFYSTAYLYLKQNSTLT
jgi:hypothetical protein